MRKQAWRLDPDAYPYRCQLPTRYTDLDTWRHVNNVAVHQLHVEARMRHQMSLLGADAWYSDDVLLRPQRVNTHFLRVTGYPQPLECGVRVVEANGSGYRLAVALFQSGACVGVQDCTMTGWQDDGPVALPDRMWDLIASESRPVADPPPGATGMQQPGDFADYPLQGELSARYGDLDADSRVAEAGIARFMEQGRSTLVRSLDLGGLGMVVASVDIEIHSFRPVGGPVVLPIAVSRVGRSSFVVQTAAVRRDRLIAVAESVMVLTDRRTGKPAPMSETFRNQLMPYCLPA